MSNTNLLGRWATGTITTSNPQYESGAELGTLASQRMVEMPVSGEIVFITPDGSIVKLLGRGSKLVDVRTPTLVVGPSVSGGRTPSPKTDITAEGHVVSVVKEQV